MRFCGLASLEDISVYQLQFHCKVCSDEAHISRFKVNKFCWIKLLPPALLTVFSHLIFLLYLEHILQLF